MGYNATVQLRRGESIPARMRYYAETYLIRIIQQYSEVDAERAQQIVSDLITACLRQWCGESLVPTSSQVLQGQEFWLCGPERNLALWVRVTEPYFDVIAKLSER